MLLNTSILFLLSLPTALSITTITAFLAPSDAAASVLAVESSKTTTYSIFCTHACAANADNNQATLVNGPSTAELTQVFDGAQRTIIINCQMSGTKGDCTTKAISAQETRTVKETKNFKAAQVVITAGVEKLGYVLATTTAEVNVTYVATTVTSGTSTTTLGVKATTSSDDGSETSASRRTSATTSNVRATGAVAQSSSSAWAAPTLGPERVGGAIIGLAGLLLAAL